jgi:hypothetical protein
MLTIVVRAFTPAPDTNFGRPPFKVHRTVIVRGNDNLSFAIRETVFFVSHDPNQPVVERVSPVVHSRHANYYDSSSAGDVHPALFRGQHRGQTV